MKCSNQESLRGPRAAPGARSAVPFATAFATAFAFALAGPAAASPLDTDPFAADRSFNGGQFYTDGFATSPASTPGNHFYYEGKKVARLGNGDVVVAALAKSPTGTQSNGLWNIGLVRYDAGGQRVTWSGVQPEYAHHNGEYVIYPKTDTATLTSIDDIKAIGDKIVVLATKRFAGSETDYDTQLYVFEDSGFYLTQIAPFGTSQSTELGGALATYRTPAGDYLMVVGTTFASGWGRGVFRRYLFGASGYSTETGIVPLNTSACWNTAMQCHAHALATSSSLLATAVPRVYVAYAFRVDANDDWDLAVSRIDVNGVGSPSWDPNNVHWNTSDGGDLRNSPVGMAVRMTGLGLPNNPFRDEIYVAQEISRRCRPGAAVTKFDHDGVPTGTVRFGGSNLEGVLCTTLDPASDYPRAIAINGARLAMIGFTEDDGRYNGTLAILDTDLTLRDFRDFSYPIGGPRQRESGLWGLVANGDGTFTATGDARWPNSDPVVIGLRGRTQAITARFASDRIFGNGLQ